jgi:hypothetical protein
MRCGVEDEFSFLLLLHVVFQELQRHLRHRPSLQGRNDLQPAVKLVGDIHHKTFHGIYIYAYVAAVKANPLMHPQPRGKMTAADLK